MCVVEGNDVTVGAIVAEPVAADVSTVERVRSPNWLDEQFLKMTWFPQKYWMSCLVSHL